MSVARFCVCGFLLSANSSAKLCPACGRSSAPAVPNIRIDPVSIEAVPRAPLALKAVEVDAKGAIIPFADPYNSGPTDDERQRRRERLREIADDIGRHQDISIRLDNPWPEAGTLQDCFLFPLRSIIWVLILAWAWAFLLILGVHFVGLTGASFFIANGIELALGVIALGFTHRLFQYAYASSSAGRGEMLSWPSFHPWAELKAGAAGFVGLLAGPIPVALLAGWFWLYGGRLEFADRLIIVELVTVALAWWLLLVVASHEFGAVHPGAIVRWHEAHGWLPLLAIAGAMTIVTFTLWFVVGVFSVGDVAGIFAQAIILPPAFVWVFAILFLLLRWLGVRNRKPVHGESKGEPGALATGGIATPSGGTF